MNRAATAFLVGVVAGTSALCAQAPGLQRLSAELERLAGEAQGVVGVGALHLESGREVYLHGDESFPMASSYKVPIAVQLLRRVDRGEISFDDMIELTPGDLHPGSGTLSALFDDPGVILSLRNLLELMLLISDNSATDLCLRVAGGGAAVTALMAELDLGDIRVDRPTELLIADYIGIEDLGPEKGRTRAGFDELAAKLSEGERAAARSTFDADVRDTATPVAMTALLTRLWRGELLSSESTALLIDILGRVSTGRRRLRGFLTDDADVAHKTGTIGGTTNDVGVITLPNGAGRVVTVVFVKESELEVAARETAIAHIARAIHDYFLFVSD